MRPVRCLNLILLFAAIAVPQEHHHDDAAEPDQLGTVSFPISCAPGFQASFNRGVALLHSFAYTRASKQFKEIADKDPTCAMAYWGEAMSLYHQLWDRPEKADLEKGHELIQKAQAAGAKTERERGYIEAAARFFQDGDVSYDARWTAYSQALDRLRAQYPGDHEAAIFYALSLVGSPHANDNDFRDRKKAVAILEPLFQEEPHHPGVAHYLIHACDNPEMARLGLVAARSYAQIAPAAPHALHMPSHIFARLGLWRDDIQSNLASEAAAEKQSSTHDRVHAMDFLLYAYLQTGQDSKARQIETEMLEIPKAQYGDMQGYGDYARVHFPALLALETKSWKDAENLSPPDLGPEYQAMTYWAKAVGAGHLHDVDAARSAVEHFDQKLEAVRKGPYAYVAEGMSTTRDEAQAWLAFAEGDSVKATHLLQTVADQQDKVGKGEVEIPAREMLADMLLELHQPDDALKEYKQSLKTDPNRFNALYGAAHAAELSGNADGAQAYYRQLLGNCADADSGETARPELARARAYLNSAGQ